VTSSAVTNLVEQQLEVASLSGEVLAVMHGIVERLMELPGADGASLSEIDDRYAYFTVSTGADRELHGRRIPLGETLGHVCVERGDVAVLRATDGTEVERCLTAGAGAIVLAPIEYDGAVRGVLGVRSADAAAFSEAEVVQIRLLARSAAIALRNAEVLARLEESERRYRDQHVHGADAVLVTDPDAWIVDANDAAAALFGYTVEELVGMHIRRVIEPASLPGRVPPLVRVQSGGRVTDERRFRRRDGSGGIVEYSLRVLDDGRIHGTLRDVTERRRTEDELRRSRDRMRAVVQTQQEIAALQPDPQALTATILERAQRLAGADGATLQRLDGDAFIYSFCSGIAAGHEGARLPVAQSLSARAVECEETIYCADSETDERVDRAILGKLGARSLICAPLRIDDENVGVLSLLAAAPNAFDELAVETTRAMAEFIGTVFRNAAELATRQHMADQLRAQAEVVEHMQMALWIWRIDDSGSFVLDHANEASESATTLRRVDVLGKRLQEILPALQTDMAARFRAVLETGDVLEVTEAPYMDERVPASLFTLKAFRLSGDSVAVTFENVTERVRARRALQESESRLRGAFNASSVGMTMVAFDGSFIEVNDRFADMLGYSVEELIQLDVAAVSHPEEEEVDREYLRRFATAEVDSQRREKRYVRKDGSILWGDISTSVVRTYDGTPAHVVSSILDITEQREATLLLQATFSNSLAPQIVMDDGRYVVDANAAGADLLGVTREECVGLRVDDLLPTEPHDVLWAQFMEKGTAQAEVTLVRPDGGERRIEYFCSANIRPGRHIAVLRDLTQQSELEHQLRQAQKMEAVGRLAGGIAHDFNNLLTAISGYSEFLATGIEDPRLKRHAEEIRKAAARAASLTGQLLAFSRRQVLQPRVLDLNAVVRDMDGLLRRLISEDVELVTLLAPALGSVRADPTQVEQVIVNLVVNARDAMPHGGSMTIETANVETDEAAWVELRLTDTGVGMTDDERQRLFDPFFTTKEGGTGLGLATVYGIVDQSGGQIEVDSAPGLGSSFRIWLPRVDEPAEELAGGSAGTAPTAGSETILLVEDETVVRELVAEILETSGYTVLQAGDGPSALELLRRHSGPVDLLVTDVVMPGMSGRDVAQAVTAMRPGTHVLYTSGYTDSAIGHHGVLEHGIAFLQKPFSADVLTRKIRQLLDEPAAA
jgi:PAS domain S-box-containing protein